MGVASAAAGLSHGFPVGGSNSRTAVNDSMGARTQVAGLTAAGMVILILLFLTGPISYLPKTVLGAVIISAALGLVELSDWRSLAATDKVEVAIAAAAMACVIVIGVLEGIVVAVALSLVDVVRRSARPHDAVLGWDEELGRYADVAVHRRARQTPGVLVYRLDDRLFFANARYVKGRIREAINGARSDVRWLVFDAEAVTHVDASGLEALADIVNELHETGVVLAVARLKTRPKQRLDEVGLTDAIGPDRFYPTVHAAVEACA
jgi:MFS superfamily sulfate permease-like transporter